MDSPTVELRTALASYSVHRALLATRSTFFEGACRNGFQEEASGIINLTEDDEEAVEHMVYYFYHLDYLNKPLSHRTSQRTSQRSSNLSSPVTSRFSRPHHPQKLNLALLEDPLLAQASAASPLMPLTPPAEETMYQPLDASLKLPDTPMAYQFAEQNIESTTWEPEVDSEKAHLITHAKVYAIAEKYGIAGLKSLARSKFSYQILSHLDSLEFADACQEVYESTIHTDRGLRDIIIQTFRANPDLSMRQDVEMAVRETPGLAFELFRMASGLPVSS